MATRSRSKRAEPTTSRARNSARKTTSRRKKPAPSSKAKPVQAPTTGGRNALSGFLFQLVGTLALPVVAIPTSASDSDASAVLRVLGTTTVSPERWDQDALATGLSPEDGNALIQFKWSGDGAAAIPPAELREICTALARSADLARGAGVSINAYILSSNRPLSAQSLGLQQRAASRSGSRKPEWTKRAWRVLGHIRHHRIASTSAWHAELGRWGKALGCTEAETQDGVAALMLGLAEAAAAGNNLDLTAEKVSAAFVGATRASTLQADSVRARASADLQRFGGTIGIAGEPLVRRKLVQDIGEAARASALVVVEGHGGYGKTVALCKWTESRLSDVGNPSTAFSAIALADQIDQKWLVNVLSMWGGVHPAGGRGRSGMTSSDLIARVRSAHEALKQSSPPPILALAIDAADEGTLTIGSETRRLVSAFAELAAATKDDRPIATLVVSCRDSRLLLDSVLTNPQGLETPRGAENIPVIAVTEFTAEELYDAAEVARPGSGLGHRLFSAVNELMQRTASGVYPLQGALDSSTDRPTSFGRGLSARGSATSAFMLDPTANAGTPGQVQPALDAVSSTVIRALLHPAMWRMFRELDADVQDRVLLGDAAAIEEMAKRFLRWFVRKAIARHGPSWRSMFVLPRVHGVAVEAYANPALFVDTACWIRESAGGVNSGVLLFRELLSSGIIHLDGQRWWWRHEFVGRYLASAQLPMDVNTGAI
jgi:hypothetical protein